MVNRRRNDAKHFRRADRPDAEACAAAPDRRGLTIVTKLGIVMGAMTALLLVVSGVLFGQLQQVTRTYDTILASEVRSGLQARKMQVEFKKQVQEWKNILLRGFVPDDLAKYTRQFREHAALVDALRADLAASTTDDVVRSEVSQFRTEHTDLNRGYDAALASFVSAGVQDPRVPDRAVRARTDPRPTRSTASSTGSRP